MIIASLTRMSLGKPGWSYREFDDLEEFLEWLLDNPEKESAVARVTEFRAGEPHKVEAKDWGSRLAELRASAVADRKHTLLWGRPGL